MSERCVSAVYSSIAEPGRMAMYLKYSLKHVL